jgi:hypothetical protein
VPLFECLSFGFYWSTTCSPPPHPDCRGRTRVHEPPELFCGFLHCYYEDIYGTRPGARELQKPLIWLGRGFDRPPSRDAVDRFLTDSNTSSTMFSIISSSRPPLGACSTLRTESLRRESKRFHGTTMPRGTTTQPLKNTTTASAVRSSRREQNSHRSGVHASKTSTRGDGGARHN